MKKIKIPCIAICLCLIFSCEKETQLYIPKPTTKLVVNSILVANKPIEVYVGKSNYALDTNSMYIENALVQLINLKNGSIDTLLYSGNGIYTSVNQICIENTIYTIKVVTTEFERATSTAYVPESIKFTDYTFNKDAGIGRDGFKNKILTVKFEDDVETVDYYMLLLEWYSLDSIPMQGYVHNNVWYSYSPIVMAEGGEDEFIFSDVLFNGKQAAIPMNFHFWDYDTFYNLNYCVKCYLITVNQDYYKYHKSNILYQNSENDIWQVNSPPQIYSNIENAFGIFSGINVADSIIINF